MSEAEEDEPRATELGGVIHREYWGWEHKKCVLYCRDENHYHKQKRDHRACQNCYGKIVIRSIHDSEVEPEPSWWARLAFRLEAWMLVRARMIEEAEERRRFRSGWRRWSEPCDNCAGPGERNGRLRVA